MFNPVIERKETDYKGTEPETAGAATKDLARKHCATSKINRLTFFGEGCRLIHPRKII
jgi:hypothetical protein